jgi:hypothetical protein
MFQPKYVPRALLLCALAACTGDMTAPTVHDEASTALSDGANSGPVPGFYFLPPMVPSPSYSGTFDAALQPRVEICQLAGAVCGPTVASYPFGAGSGSVRVDAAAQHYIANWNTPKSLDPAQFYRVQVFVGAFRLGYADVDVVRTGKEKDSVDQMRFVPLIAGQTLPVKFRIETGIAGQVVVSPATASVAVGGTQQFTATVTDLHGNPIPGAPAAWSTSAAAVATVNVTGLATGVATGQATITATSGAASGSATLTVFNPNTPPVAAPDTFDAIGNVTVPVAAPGLLANDSDGESDALTVVPGTFPTSGGGTVSVNADGSFTYLSAAGFTGMDSFSYTVTDGQGSATATAAMNASYRVWYVSNASAAPGDGRDISPFTTLKGAEAASASDETIFLLRGTGGTAGYDEGIVLKPGQALTGQGVPADVTAALNGGTVVLLQAGSAPLVTRHTAGTTVQVASNNVIQGFNASSSAGAVIAGNGFGTLVAAAMAVSANGGASLDLANGTAAAVFTALYSAGSPAEGLRLVGAGGSVAAPAGLITGAAGAAVMISGGGDVAYGGNIVNTAGRSVLVQNRTGGEVTLSGDVQDGGTGIRVAGNSGGTIAFTGGSKVLNTGASPAVSLEDNAGAIIQFAGGGLSLTTSTATAFSAEGGGTLTVTGANNVVGTTAATAISIANTTIGAAGVTFRSVSATGGPNGIALASTGSLNGLQVTGTGAPGSGGSITNVVGGDGATSGIAVYLAGVRNVELRSMALSNASNFAVRGDGVEGFVLENVVVGGSNGDNALLGEGSISFTGLTGAARIAGSTVSGGFTDNLRVRNTSGTLDRLRITESTFGLNSIASSNDGVRLEASGGAVLNVSVEGSTFVGARADVFDLLLQGGAVSDLVFAHNSVANAHPAQVNGAASMVILGTGSGTALTYAITDNTFRDPAGSAIVVRKGSSASFAGSITDNTIGVSGVANSGSRQGSGIDARAEGGGTHTVRVAGNSIRQYNNFGILLQVGAGGTGAMNASVTGNTIAQPGTTSFVMNGIQLNAGTNTGDAHQVCLALAGNSMMGSGANGGTDFRLRQRMVTTVRLPGYVGLNNDNAAVSAFVQANNPVVPSGNVANTVSTGGGGYVGGAACAQP